MESCENCGRRLSAWEQAFNVKRCSECTEIPAATPSAPARMAPDPIGLPPAANAPADFWTRFLAYIIDGVAAGLVGLALLFGMALLAGSVARASGPIGDGGSTAITVVAGAVYVGFAFGYPWLGNAFGQTLGKRMLGLGVVSARDNQRIGLRRGFVRLLVQTIGAIPLYLGWLWSIWDADKQAWHDKAVGSLVVQDPGFVGDGPRLSVPLVAGGALATFLVTGALVGAVVGLLSDAQTEEEAIKDATAAFEERDAHQAQIDVDYPPCSTEWSLATSQNYVQAFDRVFPMDDDEGAVEEADGHLRGLCATSDIDRYCRGFAETLGSRVEEVITGIQSDVETGCLSDLRAQFTSLGFEVGDCLIFDFDLGDRAVDCAEPHDAEVIHVTSMPADPAYPGEDVVIEFADSACPVTAESYYYPFALDWGVGNRRIVCLDE